MVKTGQSVTVEFTTANPSTGAAVNADSLPVGTLFVDGVTNAAVVTVTNITTGVYKATVTLPVLTPGQIVGIRTAVTVSGVAGQGIIWEEVADTAYVSDVQSQVVAGVPQTSLAISSTLTTGTLIGGTYADTYLNNNVYLTTAPVNTPVGGFTLNRELDFNIGSASPYKITINGRFTAGSSRSVLVHIWNWTGTPAWDALADLTMINSSTDANFSATFLAAHVQTGTGAVKLRFTSTSTTVGDRLYLDEVLATAYSASASASQIAEATHLRMAPYAAYSDGVWLDTTGGGFAGTTVGTHGLGTHPCSTIADALTIAASLGVKRLYFKPGTSVTLPVATDFTGWRFIGPGRIALDGATIADCVFDGSYTVSGIGIGDDMLFLGCGVGPAALEHSYFRQCMFKGDITLTAGDEYHLLNCSDAVAGGGVTTFIFAAGAELYARQWAGGIELSGMATGDSATIDGRGRVLIASDCAGGDLTIRGEFTITDSVTDGFAGTLTDSARWAEDQSVASVTGSVDSVTDAVTVTGLHDFDPATDVVARVTLVDTTTDVTTKTGYSGTATNMVAAAPIATANAAAVWAELLTAVTTNDSIGKRLKDFMTTLVYTAPPAAAPVVGDIADAVWDEALAGHLATGKTGKALSDAGAVADLSGVLSAIAALPDDTDVAALDALLDAIKAKTDKIGALEVTVASPVAVSGDISLYAGDDYSTDRGREISFLIADTDHSLSLDEHDSVVSLKCKQGSWPATSVTSTAAGYTIVCELTNAETSLITYPTQRYEVEIVYADKEVVTLAEGTLTVRW